MAGEEKGTQVPGASEGAKPGTGVQEATPLTPEQISALAQEVASLKVRQERLDNENRALQSKADREIAAEKKRGDEKIAALEGQIRGEMEKEGATTEELAAFSTEYKRRAEELSYKDKADRYDELQATQGLDAKMREHQNWYINQISEVAGIKIPPDHPDIKRTMDDTPEDFENSVKALAKTLLAEQGKEKGKEDLSVAEQALALSSLGGAAPGGAVNPIADIDDPDELARIWAEQGRPVPPPSDTA